MCTHLSAYEQMFNCQNNGKIKLRSNRNSFSQYKLNFEDQTPRPVCLLAISNFSWKGTKQRQI